MASTFARHIGCGVIAVSVAAAIVACRPSSPQRTEGASEPTAAWTKACNAGDPAALAALYAEDARSLPPDGVAVVGRNQIEAYWRDDIGQGGVTSTLTPVATMAAGD